MKLIISLLLILSVTIAKSQELDKLYYILGYNTWDFSLPYQYGSDLKSCKMTFEIYETDLDKAYRFSEVTGFKFKKRKPKKDCLNCHQFYKFIGIPSFYRYGNFFDFKYSRSEGTIYALGEVELEKQHGFYKPDILKNVTQLQMKSFLAGMYLDTGSIKGDTIKFEFHNALNQKLIIIKDFINTIEGAQYLSVKHRNDEGDVYGPTLLLVPNKILWGLFRNEEERKKNTFVNQRA